MVSQVLLLKFSGVNACIFMFSVKDVLQNKLTFMWKKFKFKNSKTFQKIDIDKTNLQIFIKYLKKIIIKKKLSIMSGLLGD